MMESSSALASLSAKTKSVIMMTRGMMILPDAGWIWIAIFLMLSLFSSCAMAQSVGDPAFKHELPPGVEFVNPKDFGLTEDQLGGLLSNVKVLGGGQIGDTKTQILTVGFNGDEDLNFDDFEIPGLTDKKVESLPNTKEKEIANAAFAKFKEFFKDPSKSGGQNYEQPSPRQSRPQEEPTPPPTRRPPPPEQKRRKPQHEPQVHQYHKSVRPSQDDLQQHYPVTLVTQPQVAPSPQIHNDNNVHPQQLQIHVQQPNIELAGHRHQFLDPNLLHNHNLQHQPSSREPEYASPSAPGFQPPPVVRQSSHSIAFANNNQPSHSFGAKLPPTSTPTPQPSEPLVPPNPYSQSHSGGDDNVHVHPNQVYSPELKDRPPYRTIIQRPYQHQQEQQDAIHFALAPQHHEPNHTPPPLPPPTTDPVRKPSGKIVRNQLLFSSNLFDDVEQTNIPPPVSSSPSAESYLHAPNPNEEYRTITQTKHPLPPPPQDPQSQLPPTYPVPPSSSFLQKFPPEDPQRRPVSHVFFQQGKDASPISQTSFHPRFQAPTANRFVNDFRPSLPNQVTTPGPPRHFDVTPSMPMILISTNENAITDPSRMHEMRKFQRHLAESSKKRLKAEASSEFEQRQPHSLDYQHQSQPQSQSHKQPYNYQTINFKQVIEPPPPRYHNHQEHPTTKSHSPLDTSSYNDNANSNQISVDNYSHKNYHQQQQQPHPYKFNPRQQPFHQYHDAPSPTGNQQYYQQQQVSQPSNHRYHVEEYPPPPSTGIHPPPPLSLSNNSPFHHSEHTPFYRNRHKRGNRGNRLSTILRGIWGE